MRVKDKRKQKVVADLPELEWHLSRWKEGTFFLIEETTLLRSRISFEVANSGWRTNFQSSWSRLFTSIFCLYCSNFTTMSLVWWKVMFLTVSVGSFNCLVRKSVTVFSRSSSAFSGIPQKPSCPSQCVLLDLIPFLLDIYCVYRVERLS